MLDFTKTSIGSIIAHQVGNQTNDEDLILSNKLLDTDDERLQLLLFNYFLHPFLEMEEFYAFSFPDENFNLNPIYQYATSIFSEENDFKEISESLAKYLFDIAVHPQIKSGDLFVVQFNDTQIDGQPVNVLGLFKAENRQAFLQLNKNTKAFSLNYEDGINVDKLDKGCLIFNTEKDNGYRVCVVDKSNKSSEAKYWVDQFLNLKVLKTNFHQTNEFLGITKEFVTKQLAADYDVSKADKIDFLNRSVDYFKKHDNFDKQEFEEEVFHHPNLIKSFQQFDDNYRRENEVDLEDSFAISAKAVKKQARVFKSVLKLDKNFHIYIHGNRELIEQGVDEDGRKFYKIYYENEV